MVSRRFLTAITIITTAAAFFLLGDFHARAGDAADQFLRAFRLIGKSGR